MVTTLIMMTYTRFDKLRRLVCIRLRIKRYFIFDFAVETVIVKLPDFRYDRVTDFFKLGLSGYPTEKNCHINIFFIKSDTLTIIGFFIPGQLHHLAYIPVCSGCFFAAVWLCCMSCFSPLAVLQ